MTEDIRTQFTGIISTIIEISEKSCKLTSKDIDSLITNATTLNKKNAFLKKMYSLEEDINKMKMAITKMSFSNDSQDKKDNPVKEVKEKEVKEKEVKEKEVKEKEVKEKEVKEPVKEIKKKKEKEPVKEIKEPVKEIKKKKEKEHVKEIKKKKEEEESDKEENKDKKVKKKKEEDKKVNTEPILDTKETQDIDKDADKDDESQPLHIKRKKIPKQIKTLVWNEYIGNDIMSNKCLCCKKEKIDIRNFHCGHVIAESKGGDLTIKNLRPICAPCNASMGTMSMNDFALTYFGYSV